MSNVVPLRDENGPDRDVLVLVALRTNQHNIARRLNMILAASSPEHPKADAEVIAREQPTANDADHLDCVFGYDVLARLGWHRVLPAGSEKEQ